MENCMTMEELAARFHARDTQPRIVGGKEVPYIEHPRAVVRRLESWGCSNDMGKDGWRTLDIAWGHDLLEDTAVTPKEISDVAGEDVLHDIEILSNLPGKHADKAAYIQYVAEHANTVTLLVKLADRLCNTEDFLVSEGVEKAARYFEKAEPVFQAIHAHKVMIESWIEEDPKTYFAQIDDEMMVRILGNAIADANAVGHKVGARWSWFREGACGE